MGNGNRNLMFGSAVALTARFLLSRFAQEHLRRKRMSKLSFRVNEQNPCVVSGKPVTSVRLQNCTLLKPTVCFRTMLETSINQQDISLHKRSLFLAKSRTKKACGGFRVLSWLVSCQVAFIRLAPSCRPVLLEMAKTKKKKKKKKRTTKQKTDRQTTPKENGKGKQPAKSLGTPVELKNSLFSLRFFDFASFTTSGLTELNRTRNLFLCALCRTETSPDEFDDYF